MKTGRTLHTEDAVRRMRDHVERFSAAKKIANDIVDRAEVWANLDDAYVRDLPPPADIFRGFLPSFDGCPVHGEAVFQTPGGPWQVDIFNRPWKIKCAVGGEEYPSNEFLAYYRTGDRALLTGDYADDGPGWDPDDGRSRFWFVAHYCYRLWHQLIPALQDLGRAYLMTGDPRYGRKGAILLDRMAALFPTMDHADAVLVRPELSGRDIQAVFCTPYRSRSTSGSMQKRTTICFRRCSLKATYTSFWARNPKRWSGMWKTTWCGSRCGISGTGKSAEITGCTRPLR